MLPGTIEGMKHVCYFQHALALDEWWVKFLPEYVYAGSATDPEAKKPSLIDHKSPHSDHKVLSSVDADGPTANNKPSDNRPPIDKEDLHPSSSARVKSMENLPQKIEVWFAGTHSDM